MWGTNTRNLVAFPHLCYSAGGYSALKTMALAKFTFFSFAAPPKFWNDHFFLGSTGGYLEGLQRGVPFIAGYPSLADWARGVGCIETRSIGGLLAPSFTDAHANAAGDASGVWFKKKRRRKVNPTESRDFLCPLVN